MTIGDFVSISCGGLRVFFFFFHFRILGSIRRDFKCEMA